MKNIFRIVMAVAILFTASCAKEDISSSIGGGEVEVTFTANLTDLGTRAYGDGTTVDKVYLGIYNAQGKLLEGLTKPEGYKILNGSKAVNIDVVLLKGKVYQLVFWAQNSEAQFYSMDWENRQLTVNYKDANGNHTLSSQDEKRDAFYLVDESFTAGQDDTEFHLKRPFAQLRAAISEKDKVHVDDNEVSIVSSTAVVENVANVLDLSTEEATVSGQETVTFKSAAIPDGENTTINVAGDKYYQLSMNYLLVDTKRLVQVAYTFVDSEGTRYDRSYGQVPVQRNYRTNILGQLISSPYEFEVEILPDFDAAYDVEGETVTAKVDTVEEFVAAFEDDSNVDVVVLEGDIDLNDLFASLASTRAAADPTLTIKSGKEFTIDLNGKKLSSTSTEVGKNYNMFDVRGTLTVKNGTMEYKHLGENMGWGSSTNLFNVTDGGILNLEGVTAKNLGGSDMGFVAHLNNWGEVTLNVENCTLESNYVAVRVFNSGYDMNNVTIKNSTLKGNSAAFWVHNYTVEDFGSASKAEAQKALLNLNIYGQGNTFSPDINGIRYGFTNSIRTDAYGIIKTVSEDGTEVTLGSIVENGLVRRGVAGAEENTTIKKAIVGEGVTTLYDRTFRRFYALETVELPSTLTTIGAAGSGVFQSCTALKNIVLPESVTVLGKGTFQECSSLESINIPEGVTRIESDCLRASGLVEVEFHAGVTYFGAQAFRDCKQLKKVVINAPEFTIEANAFGVTAGALPGTVIYVANAEMKAYLESTLAYKNQFTIVAPNSASTAGELIEALENGKNVVLTKDLTFSANDTTANSGYGATGVTVDGSVLDGNGNTLTVNNAWGTWDCAVNAVSGTIKNLTVSGAMRGIFMGSANGDVYIDNVIFDNVIYTFNSDGGNKNYGVYISNCTINGWTSHSDVHKEVVYTNCSFGKGNGYAFCRPYGPTVYKNCEFSTDMEFDTSESTVIVFKNCTYGGVKITADNAASLKTGETTFFYNGVGSASFE